MPGTEHTFRLNWASFSGDEKCTYEGPDHSNGLYPSVRPTRISAEITSSGSWLQDGAAKGKDTVIPSVGKFNRKMVCDGDERRPDAGPVQSNGGYCSTSPMWISAALPKASSGSQLQNGAAEAMYPAAAYTIPQAQTVPRDSGLTDTTLSIGNLDPNATEEELRQICVQFGELVDVKIPVGQGCGLVQYTSRASAKQAVQRLHGTLIGQQVVRLSWGRSPANQQVEGATGMEQNKVYDPMYLPYIDKGAKAVADPDTGRSKGYGFVKFAAENEKTCAMTEMNGAYCSTRSMRTSAAVPKTSFGSQLQDGAAKGKEAVIPSARKINRKIVCDADEGHTDAGPDQSNGGYCSTSPMRISARVPKASSGSQLQIEAASGSQLQNEAAATYPEAAYTVPQAQTVPPDSDLTNTTLCIGNLDPNATEEELRQICVQFGELIDVNIPAGNGCGFVQYSSRVSAKEAVQRLHGTVIGQQVVRLSWGRSPADQQVDGATGMEQNKVYDPMNLLDIDKEAKVVTDPNTGRSEGYGFVKFATEN